MVHISRRTDALKEHMVIGLSGDVDLSAVVHVRSAFHEVLNDGWNSVLVDLSDVTFVDSAALGILVGLNRRCCENGGVSVLVNPQPEVSRILTLSGLDVLLSVAPDIEAGCALSNNMLATRSATTGATT